MHAGTPLTMDWPWNFLHNARGGIAIYFALGAPLFLALAGGAVDITSVTAERNRFRSIAEGAALAGAGDLALASARSVAIERARAWAQNSIREWQHAPASTVTAELITLENGDVGVRVNISAQRESIMGRLIPPGGWNIAVSATAISVGRTPLCVLATQRGGDKVINVKDRGTIQAPGCMVHSNRDIIVENSGAIDAGYVQAVHRVNGNVNPGGSTGAQSITDPFASLDLNPPTCNYTAEIEYTSGTHTLPAGVHCAKIKLTGTAILRLSPGEHWFVNADLEVKDDARLEGTDVVLLFDDKSKFKFDDRALVNLEGRETGRLAGFVMAGVRDNRHDFIITSENVETLLGVVYVPNARLIIDGKAEVARESAWTVMVALRIELKGNPTLFVNANYRAAEVPVPSGVGPSRTSTRLVE